MYLGLLHFQNQDYDAVIESMSQSRVPLDIGLLAAAYTRQNSIHQGVSSGHTGSSGPVSLLTLPLNMPVFPEFNNLIHALQRPASPV